MHTAVFQKALLELLRRLLLTRGFLLRADETDQVLYITEIPESGSILRTRSISGFIAGTRTICSALSREQ